MRGGGVGGGGAWAVLCQCFAAATSNKIQYRSKLNTENELSVAISKQEFELKSAHPDTHAHISKPLVVEYGFVIMLYNIVYIRLIH